MSNLIYTLEKHQKVTRACHLIEHGFRTSIIALETGLPFYLVRRMIKDMGYPPKPGSIPGSDAIMKTRGAQIHCSLLMGFYQKIAGPACYEQIDIDSLITAFHQYTDIAERLTLPPSRAWMPMSINHGWILARDLRIGLSRFERCDCGTHFLTVANQHFKLLDCPICNLKRRNVSLRAKQVTNEDVYLYPD